MTAADSTARLIEADAQTMADRATSVIVNALAYGSLLVFGGVCALVVFVAVAR